MKDWQATVGREKATLADLDQAGSAAAQYPAWQRRWFPYVTGGVLLALILTYGVRALLPGEPAPVHLVVYAFSTQEEVFSQSVFQAFEEAWKMDGGQAVTLEGVFGPSGTLAGQINLGAPADIAVLSNAHHVTYLRIGKRIREETRAKVVGYTPMVIVTRPGNPLGISEFSDLARPGLRLLHASPRSSGAGEWALLAEYGSARMTSGEEAATAQLHAVWRNVRVLAPSARAALTLFELGAGDALVTYEQDALLAQARGVPLEIVVPPHTIMAEHVVVVVDDNVTDSERPAAEAFVDYLLSDAGQARLARYYQRSATMESSRFAPLVEPYSVADLGEWPQAYRQIVERLWQGGIEPQLNLDPSPQLVEPGD